jgi:hypothetical protein
MLTKPRAYRSDLISWLYFVMLKPILFRPFSSGRSSVSIISNVQAGYSRMPVGRHPVHCSMVCRMRHFAKDVVSRLLLLVLGMAMVCCAPTLYEEYLSESLHQVSQDDIKKQLGPPRTVTSAEHTSVWTYQASGERVYGSECTTYMLLFDREKRLQDWLRLSC